MMGITNRETGEYLDVTHAPPEEVHAFVDRLSEAQKTEMRENFRLFEERVFEAMQPMIAAFQGFGQAVHEAAAISGVKLKNPT